MELLQCHAAIAIEQARDQMPVQPNHAYVIPPGKDLSMVRGVLRLTEPAEPRGLRLPIDHFLKSLADDQQQNAIGVILSGMGSDGTLGLRAVRAAAGACFVQMPESAEFDSMPRSAIDAGLADVVAPADELPGRILAYAARIGLGALAETEAMAEPLDHTTLDKVIVLLRSQTGHDFSLYKKSTLARRIERRMGLHQLARRGDYLRYLRENPLEAELLFNEMLIGVTNFFRDPAVWEQFKTEVIPALLASHPDGAELRAWVPGCSTGEEAYTLAMIFKEAIEESNPLPRYSMQIFASDLDKDAIAVARAGIYPRSVAADVSEKRLNRFFTADPGSYRVCNEIREMVIFAAQNIIVDSPFTKLDVLSCRNLLIYLEPELQAKLIQLFHYSLNGGGYLLLGSAESVGAATALFTPLPGKSRLYQRLQAVARVLPMGFPAAFVNTHASLAAGATAYVAAAFASAPDLQASVEKLLLQRFTPVAILATDTGDMLYVSVKTGKYLEPAPGKASLNLFAMAREGLKQALSEAFRRAVRQKTPDAIKNVKLADNGSAQYVDITVQPLEEPAGLRGRVLVVFKDVASPARRGKARSALDAPPGDNARVELLMQELELARDDAKSMREEMQTAQEELKSSNEELQSTNEELQSTNEELTTSKEEMQSMNEELQTVNHELQAKVTELSRTSSDMKNLLDSTEIATLFLDDALKVRRFTAQTTRIFKLIPGDAGRPITDVVTDLNYPEMVSDAREVLRTLAFRECDVPAAEGRWFKVRTMPYRTQDNRIDGLVITFSDISAQKQTQAELRRTQERLQALLANATSSGRENELS